MNMLQKNNIIFVFLISILFLSSCSSIDITDISCERMSSYSSVKVSELIDKPKVINIDDKDLRLRFIFNRTIGINVRNFPENIFPEIIKNCYNFSFGYIFYSSGYKESYTESFFLEPYLVERIWFINKENEVWETSNITSNYYLESHNTPNSIKINGTLPSTKNIISNVIVKFKYKEKDYFIRYDFNDRY
ncbi:MAG: hypothetical protein ACK4IX_04350 [Candidatus Sericytochromatia bacterium]